MRIGRQPAFGIADADLVQQIKAARPRRFAAKPLMQAKAFAQLLFDGVQRVQAGHRLLEDKADVIAAHPTQFCRAGPHHFAAQIAHRPRHGGAFRQQTHGRQRRHRFARPAFAHQRHGFAFAHAKADVAHRLHLPAILPKADV